MEIRKKEVLRFLGYRGQKMEDDLDRLIDDCIKEIKAISKPLYVYQLFEINHLKEEVKLLDGLFSLKGKSISAHLINSSKVILLAATLGVEVDRKIKAYQYTNMTRAVVLDACGAEAIESVCNEVEEEIEKIAKKEGCSITSRFSPGYGDFSIGFQPKILQQLNAFSKIGLSCTNEHILLPRKSITACIGFTQQTVEKLEKNCKECNTYTYCRYKREEKGCELITGETQ